MDISVQLDPEQINAAVADAIINSAIGTQLRRIIDAQVQSLSKNWDNPIEAIVKTEIRGLLAQTIRAEYADALREAIRTALTEERLALLVDQAVNSIVVVSAS